MSEPRAVLVDCNDEVVKETQLLGRAWLVPAWPQRVVELDVHKPHRHDSVDRVFEANGRSADGAWIYRETHWGISWCDCQKKKKRKRAV